MADIRIKDLTTTAAASSADDYIAVDGTSNGTRKLSAATPSFATSVTVPGVVGPTSTDLTLTGGSTGASLVLGQGSNAASFNRNITVSLTPSGNPELILSSVTGTPIVSLFGTGPTAAVNPFVAFPTAGNLRFGTATGVGAAGAAEKVRVTNTGNLLIGTTTDMTGSGGLKVSGGNIEITAAAKTFFQTSSQSKFGDASGVVTGGSGTDTAIGYFSAGKLIFGITGGAEKARLTDAGNLLIGTTTDAASLAGGLVVNGSGAGAAASSTTTGALRVTGGVGVSGEGYFGGDVTITKGSAPNLSIVSTTAGGTGNGAQISLDSRSFTSGALYYLLSTGPSNGGGAGQFMVYHSALGRSVLTSTAAGDIPIPAATSASSSTVGALIIGNGTAATNVAIGGGNIVAGNTITVGIVGGANSYLNLNGGTTETWANFQNTAVTSGRQFWRVGLATTTGGTGTVANSFMIQRLADAGASITDVPLAIVPGTVTIGSAYNLSAAGAVTIAGTVIHTLSATPASASAAGTVGTMSWDANYIYICTATNTWKRVAIATW